MSRSNTLLTGGLGLLGLIWGKLSSKDENIFIGTRNSEHSYNDKRIISINYEDEREVTSFLESNNIHRVVNLFGLTDVELCEQEQEKAYYFNQIIPGRIASCCKYYGCSFIHLSTDHLYNDELTMNSEDKEVSLVNVYAKSKYYGEVDVTRNNPNALIIRTNFFGKCLGEKRSFSDWILNSIKNKLCVRLYDDIFFNPVNAYRLISYTNKLVEKECHGTYNISTDQLLTKYEFGLRLCKHLGLSPEFITRDANTNNNKVRRPKCMGLSNNKLKDELGLNTETIDDHIKDLKKNN